MKRMSDVLIHKLYVLHQWVCMRELHTVHGKVSLRFILMQKSGNSFTFFPTRCGFCQLFEDPWLVLTGGVFSLDWVFRRELNHPLPILCSWYWKHVYTLTSVSIYFRRCSSLTTGMLPAPITIGEVHFLIWLCPCSCTALTELAWLVGLLLEAVSTPGQLATPPLNTEINTRIPLDSNWARPHFTFSVYQFPKSACGYSTSKSE